MSSPVVAAPASGPIEPPRLRAAFAKMFAGGVAGKLLGLVRELALAASFGTGSAAAAFRAAQTATLIPTHYFSADTLNGGFIPLCARYLREDPPRARALYWSVAALMAVISAAIAAVLFVGAPLWAALLVPGFGAEQRALTAGMLQAMAVGVPFYVQASLAAYLEMAQGRYLVGSLRAAAQNVGLLAGIGIAALTGNVLWLGWGFAIYSALFAAVGVWSVARSGMLGRPAAPDWREARTVLGAFAALARPLMLLPLMHQGALAVERIIASLVGIGAVAGLDYAKTISETGLALIAVPLGMAGLAELGRAGPDGARARLERLLPALLLLTVPVSVFLALNAEGIVRALFARGRFGEDSVAVTSLILIGLGLGFWAQVTGYVLARGLTAIGRNGRVAAAVGLASGAGILVNLTLHAWLGALALGLATGASSVVLAVATARALGLGAVMLRTLAPLAAGAAAYVPLGLLLRDGGLASLALSAAACTGCWLVAVRAAPALRAAARDVARRPALGWTR